MNKKTEILSGAVVVPVKNPRLKLPEKGLQSRGEHHITLITPPEAEKLIARKGWTKEEFEERMKGLEVAGKPSYKCIGKQEKKGNAVYFVVVDWPKGQKFRKKLGLKRADLHVTLGFRDSDIHDVPKGADSCIRPLKG